MLDVIPLSATIFGLIALAGGGAGYFKASRGDSIIKYQSIEIDNLRTKVSDYESDIAALQAKLEAKKEALAEKHKQLEYVRDLNQKSPELEQLTEAITNQTDLITKLLQAQGLDHE